MKKQKIIILAVIAIIAIGGVSAVTVVNRKEALQAKVRASQIQANIVKEQKEGELFNFNLITPASSYINARDAIANIVLKSVLTGEKSLDNQAAINAVKDIVTQIPDSTLAAWSQNGTYPIVEPAMSTTPNNLFLHVYFNNKTTISYFVFENGQGQIGSQQGNTKSIMIPSVSKIQSDIASVITPNIMKRYPTLEKKQVESAVNQVLSQKLLADIYEWSDQGCSNPVIVNSDAENKILIQVPINYNKINVYISFENQGTNSVQK